ncbi:MAG TPA: UMP kinase, partial [Methanocorpusculum sp.]|nr:UMP kinase [Methanocorpusculum sp.]
MKRVVAAVGGSVLVSSLETHRMKEWSTSLINLSTRGVQVFVVVGGGGEARKYIEVCRDIGLDEATADEIGIRVTRFNAAL